MNAQWDAEDPKLYKGYPVNWNTGVRDQNGQSIYHPAWGLHRMRYESVMKKDKYYTVRVDDKKTLVGFDRQVPERFKKIPFFVGVAHSGYHVFPGTYGKVIEAHSMRGLDTFDNLEVGDFNPLMKGGSPRWTPNVKYRSGIVAVPPGY